MKSLLKGKPTQNHCFGDHVIIIIRPYMGFVLADHDVKRKLNKTIIRSRKRPSNDVGTLNLALERLPFALM